MKIDISLVRKLIEQQFSQWADLSISPVATSGWDNRTFHLGENMSVRLPSDAQYAFQVAKEQYWLPKLQAHLPLMLPKPIAMGEPSKEYPWHWSIYQWLQGASATNTQVADLNHFAKSLAEFLSALQQCDINEIVKGAFKSGYLGYYLFSGSEKLGLMSEALQLLVNYAFDLLQLHRLEANIQPGNINSLRLIHNCGFIKEGFSRKYLYINDQWQDHVRYALTIEMRAKSNEGGKLLLSHLKKEDIPEIVKQFNNAKLNKTITVFDEYFEEQTQQEQLIWLAQLNGRYVGYVSLVWDSYYKPFSEKNIREIKDLNVINEFQKQGIGTTLLLAAEREAFKPSATVGLGVGLYEDYGNAQSLYFKLGYCPDGNRITYNYEKVLPGKDTSVDDELCLWLTKNIAGDERSE